MTTTTTKSNGKVETLTEQHARLIREWATTAGAPKAVLSKRIVDAEYEMELQGISYSAWSKPSAAVSKSWVLSESELIERLFKARAIADDATKRDVIRDRASKDAAKLEEQAKSRGVSTPEDAEADAA